MKAERMLPEMGDGLTFRAEEKKGGLVDSGWGGPERNQPGRAHPGAGARGHLEEPWATVSGQLRGWTSAGSGGARWWPCGGGECWACRHPAPPPRPSIPFLLPLPEHQDAFILMNLFVLEPPFILHLYFHGWHDLRWHSMISSHCGTFFLS